MLLNSILNGGDIREIILSLLISIMTILPALTIHEWAHGFAAYKLGDSTAKADGRLSLNPLDHLDPVGSLLLLLVGFGWAKPVPVNTRHFKKPRRDFALVSLAGPLSNFIAAFVSAIVFGAALGICLKADASEAVVFVVTMFLQASIIYNVGLGLFNLIPLPPLDGSNILLCILPNRLASKYARLRYYTHYIFIALIILMRLPIFNRISLIGPVVNMFYSIALKVFSLFM
ncbi:MAG: site-2 protease family protein [Clostridia bacterium]|nr:site-2 protease family protein [Clostridia bacterium]